jgi:hypothetical protein
MLNEVVQINKEKMHMNTRLRVYIDMDHTFCEFESARKIWQDWALTDVEKTWPWSMPGFFRSLPPMPGALEFWKTFEPKVELFFLTRPSFQNRHCYTEKAEWVFRYLGEEGVKRLIISPRKDLLMGDVLIDDATNCGQQQFEGEWWQFGSKSCPDWNVATQKLHLKYLQWENDL